MAAVREGEGEGLPSSVVDADSAADTLSSLVLVFCEDCPKLDFKPSKKPAKPPAGVCETVESEADAPSRFP